MNLIKEKRDGQIKGSTCADRSEKRKYLKEDETFYSTTCQEEDLIRTLVVDAQWRWDKSIFDILRVLLKAKITEVKNVMLFLRGTFFDALCKAIPECNKHFRFVIGKEDPHVKILREIYGCIESYMLWYNACTDTLKETELEFNPYDRCAVN